MKIYLTLQKEEVCAQCNVLAKYFKICYIYVLLIGIPLWFFVIFHFVQLSSPLMNALVFVEIDHKGRSKVAWNERWNKQTKASWQYKKCICLEHFDEHNPLTSEEWSAINDYTGKLLGLISSVVQYSKSNTYNFLKIMGEIICKSIANISQLLISQKGKLWS